MWYYKKPKNMDINKANIIGTSVAMCIFLLCILIFIFRLYGKSGTEYFLGLVFLLASLPLIYLLFTASQFQRPAIYYVQISLMLLFIIIECMLDYILKIDFRSTRWIVITYAMLFFAGTGGMIGIASISGKGWSITSIVLFLIMAFLAFYQRTKTGM